MGRNDVPHLESRQIVTHAIVTSPSKGAHETKLIYNTALQGTNWGAKEEFAQPTEEHCRKQTHGAAEKRVRYGFRDIRRRKDGRITWKWGNFGDAEIRMQR